MNAQFSGCLAVSRLVTRNKCLNPTSLYIVGNLDNQESNILDYNRNYYLHFYWAVNSLDFYLILIF